MILGVQCNENEVMKFDRKSFFVSISRLTNIEYPIGNYIGKKLGNIAEVDDNHLKCNFFSERIANCFRQTVSNVIAVHKPLGYEIIKNPINIHFNK